MAKFILPLILSILMMLPLTQSATASGIPTLPDDHSSYRQVKIIFDAIARSFGESRMAPRLVVVPNGTQTEMVVAWSEAGSENAVGLASPAMMEGYIAIEERAVSIMGQLGADRDNGIAFLLGHELAHYYQRHGWAGDFGNAFVTTEMGKKVLRSISNEESMRSEAEADHLGGFYSYLAGYDTLGVAPKALDLLYAAYKFPDKIENYPSRTERKEIATRSGNNLKRLAPVFEAGVRLILLERNEEAGRLFEHLAHTFPSREMFNNAAVAYTRAALELFRPGMVKFYYPIAIDAETRLVGMRSKTRSVDDQALRRKQMLEKAQDLLEKAIQRDKTYVSAYINLACVLSLMGDQEAAILTARKGLDLAIKCNEPQVSAQAHVVSGIANALAGDTDKANTNFHAAGQYPLAATNLVALKTGQQANSLVNSAELPGSAKETIAAISPWDSFKKEKDTSSYTLHGQVGNQPTIVIHSRNGTGWNQVLIKIDNANINTLATENGYKEKTARGIAIGTPLALVQKKYGIALRVVSTRQASWHVYSNTGIAFSLDSSEHVIGWVLFAGS